MGAIEEMGAMGQMEHVEEVEEMEHLQEVEETDEVEVRGRQGSEDDDLLGCWAFCLALEGNKALKSLKYIKRDTCAPSLMENQGRRPRRQLWSCSGHQVIATNGRAGGER